MVCTPVCLPLYMDFYVHIDECDIHIVCVLANHLEERPELLLLTTV